VAEFEPKVVGFLCRWCAYEGADAAGRGRLDMAAGLRGVRVPCSGRVSPCLVLEAFSRGADAVLILGCRPGECHYRDGNDRASVRVALLRRVLEPLGIGPERLVLEWVAAGEGERFARVVRDAVARVRLLGPLERFSRRPSLSRRDREHDTLRRSRSENGTGGARREAKP